MNHENVVAFPSNRIVKDRSVAGFTEEIERNKSEFIEYLIDKNMTAVFNQLALDGVDVDNEAFLQDYSFAVEVIRSGLMRIYGLDHPLQGVVDESLDFVNTNFPEIPDRDPKSS